MVGSGIFLTPGTIADRLPHAGLIFAAWIVGGLLSLAGALANAELGSMYPRAGGDYVYLRAAFHPLAGFLVGWLTFFAIFSGTVATLAVGFGAGLADIFGLGAGAAIPIGLATIVATSALNWVGVRWGARFNNLTGWIKVGALAFFAFAAPLFGRGDAGNLLPLLRGIGDVATPMAFLLALSPVLFSYLGWNASIYVASEIKDAPRNLPRSLFLGLALCTALYMALNAVYLYALPIEQLRATGNVGEAAAQALFGGVGGALLKGFVLASILGTLNATVLVGPRIAYAMALDGLSLPGVDRVHRVYATPTGAIALQALVASALILLLRTFPSALDFTTFCILLAAMADSLALYALRWREPGRARPYRAWGYPVVPALYLVANGAIAFGLLVARPLEAGVGLGMLALGLPFYLVLSRRRAG